MNKLSVGDHVQFTLGRGHQRGVVERVNEVSVLVRIASGALIKRHVHKHWVRRAS